jgi:hypothetical protein
MTRLTPSFIRCAGSIGGPIALFGLLSYLLSGVRDHHWWSIGDFPLLGLGCFLFIGLIWFGFVPRTLEYSEDEFMIQLLFRNQVTLPWSDLEYYYPNGPGVYMIQFEGRSTFQIAACAYHSREWRAFCEFMDTNFSDQKASGYMGGRLFKWSSKR